MNLVSYRDPEIGMFGMTCIVVSLAMLVLAVAGAVYLECSADRYEAKRRRRQGFPVLPVDPPSSPAPGTAQVDQRKGD